LKPDRRSSARKLLARAQSDPGKCREGYGLPGFDPTSNCDYKKAPFFNVLAAFWIQFMTHDWFSHSEEGHNAADWMTMGCATQLVNNIERPLSPEDIQRLKCRPEDQIDKSYIAKDDPPPVFTYDDKRYLGRAT